MTAHAAVGIGDNFPACYAGIRKGTALHKPAGRIHQRSEICVQAVGFCDLCHNAVDDLLYLHSVYVRSMLCADEERVDPSGFVIVGHLRLGIRQKQRRVQITQGQKRTGGQHEGKGHQLRCFVRGVAIHHALIARAASVHAPCNISALAGDKGGALVAFRFRHTDAAQHFMCQNVGIGHVLGRKLACQNDHVVLDQAFYGHAAFRIVTQTVRQHSVRDLVANFIWVPAGHLLACKQHFQSSLCTDG